jgi:transposase
MTPYRDINDEEWQRVAPLLPELRPRADMRGRPLANTRSVLNGVLWVMYSGATWSSMPRKYPSYQTCHRRFKAWYDSGVLRRVMGQLFGDGASEELCVMMQTRMRSHPEKGRKPDHTASMAGVMLLPAPGVLSTSRYSGTAAQHAAANPFSFASPRDQT